MHKKSVYDLLFLAHKFLAFFQAIRLALYGDHGAVMQYPIQDGGGNGDVDKDLVPLGEGLVGCKDSGRFLVLPGNELKEEVCTLNVHEKVTNFIDNKQPVLGQDLELVRQAVLKKGLFELLNELMAIP